MLRPLLVAMFLVIFAAAIPASAVSNATDLPDVITEALNDAAATGNPLVLGAVADRMATLFPMMQSDIQIYTAHIAAPATLVMAGVKDMTDELPPIDASLALFNGHVHEEEAEESDAAALTAAELNDLAVGAGPMDMIQ